MSVELALHVRGDPQLALESDAVEIGGVVRDYSRLTGKPRINSVELDGDKSFGELGLFEEAAPVFGTGELTNEELEELLKG